MTALPLTCSGYLPGSRNGRHRADLRRRRSSARARESPSSSGSATPISWRCAAVAMTYSGFLPDTPTPAGSARSSLFGGQAAGILLVIMIDDVGESGYRAPVLQRDIQPHLP